MYLFSRTARLSGRQNRAAMAWVTTVTEHVAQVTGLPVMVYSQVYSSDVGTLRWSNLVPDLTTSEAAFDKLAVDGHFAELLEQGQEFLVPGSVHDRLSAIIHPADISQQAGPLPEYGSVVETTLASGHITEGISLGVELAQKGEAITGIPTLFLTDLTGNYGSVQWVTGYASIAELESANAAINADESFMKLIDGRASACYAAQPEATRQLLFRRII